MVKTSILLTALIFSYCAITLATIALNEELDTMDAETLKIARVDKKTEKDLFKLLDEFPATVYAYNSFENQTDSDPLIGAFGSVEGMEGKIVANNCYLPGTIVEIDGKKYEVFDRMHERYGCDVFDVYMGMDYKD